MFTCLAALLGYVLGSWQGELSIPLPPVPLKEELMIRYLQHVLTMRRRMLDEYRTVILAYGFDSAYYWTYMDVLRAEALHDMHHPEENSYDPEIIAAVTSQLHGRDR